VEVVLGVSMTPTNVRMVLVEGEKADGITVEHDLLDVIASGDSATSSRSDQVIDAVLGTREGAVAGGHLLVSTGVAWSDRAEAAALREALSVRGIENVMLFSEPHAAGALAQAIGRAVGYGTTALMFVERDTATLSVVRTVDGSVLKSVSRGLGGPDPMAVLAGLVSDLETQDPRPDGMFVVGSGVDTTSMTSHLEHLVSMPVHAPDEPELALARAAALAAANVPRIDATTVGLAYSRDPEDGTTAGAADAVGLTGHGRRLAVVGAQEGRKPFLLAGSALTSIFIVGVVALVVSLAVSIQPAAEQRPDTGKTTVHPNTLPPAPPLVQNSQPSQPRSSQPRSAPQSVPPPPAPAAAPPTAPQLAPSVPVQEVAPPPTVLRRAPAPAGPPVAPPAPIATPPALFPLPVIELPVPGLPPILLTPRVDPPQRNPVPQQPQRPHPKHGRHGGDGDD
jgi:hypothetical protein